MIRQRCGRFLSMVLGVLLAVGMVATVAAQQTGNPSSGQAVPSVAAAPGGPAAGSPGSRSFVVLTSLSAPRSDTVARKLASTITESLALMMKLSGDVTVRRADFLAPTLSLARAREYYREVGANGAVYGTVAAASGGGYKIELFLWNGDSPKKAPRLFHRTLTDILASFTMADRLALTVTSTIIGRPLAEGTLRIENTKLLPSYALYADGHLVARNRPVVPILTGRREIVIAKPGGPLGDLPVQVFHVTIRRGTTTTVRLSAKEIASGAARGAKLARPAAAFPSHGARAGSVAPANGANALPVARSAREPGGRGTALIRSAASGRLFVDGRPDGTITGGVARLLTDIAPGTHRFELRYADGHHQTRSGLFRAGAQQRTIDFSYEPIRYAPAGLFHPASLTIGRHRYHLQRPNDYAAALSAVSKLPALTPGMQPQIADAKTLIGTWRLQRVFHIAWLAVFVAAALTANSISSSSSAASTNTSTLFGPSSPALLGFAALATLIPVVINAKHRGTTIGALTSGISSIASSYDRRSVPTQPVGSLAVGARSAGVLYVDGQQQGRLEPGHTRTLYDIPLGRHVVLVRYPNGHFEDDTVKLTAASSSTALFFGYTSAG